MLQAHGRYPGDASVCCHGDDAEVQPHEAPVSFPGSAHRGKATCVLLVCLRSQKNSRNQ